VSLGPRTDAERPILHRDRETKSAPLAGSLIASGALEWVQVRALVADGVSEREIARPEYQKGPVSRAFLSSGGRI
jgi:hypothetical protein